MVAYFPLTEPLVRGLKNYLVTYLPSKLQDLITEIGDGISLDPPQPAYIFPFDKGDVVDQYPHIQIIPEREDFSDRISSEFVTDVDNWMSMSIIMVGGDEEILSFQVIRYVRALVELLYDLGRDDALRNSMMGAKCFDVKIRSIQHLSAGGNQAFARGAVFSINIRTREGS